MASRRRRRFGRVFWRWSRPGSKNGNWFIRYRHRGKEVERSIGPDKKLAAQVLASIETALAREEHLGVREIAEANLAEFWPILKPVLRSRLGDRGFEVESQRYGILQQFFGTRPLKDLRASDIEDFLAHLQSARGCKAQTGNRYLALLSRVFKEAVDRGFASENPIPKVPRAREELRAVPFLNIADIDRIVAAAPSALRPLILLAADTGLRRGELLALQWRDADLARGVLTVRHSKSKRPREVPLTDRARAVLAELRSARGAVPLVGEDLVFPEIAAMNPVWGPLSVSVGFRRAAKKAGFSLRFHDLRHAFCSRLAQLGVPLSTVAILAGHSSMVVTQRYARHVPQGATHQAIVLLGKASPTLAAPAASADSATSGDARGDARRAADPPVAASA